METKHTPGPWMLLSSNNITNTAGPDWANDSHIIAEWNETNPCADANARLISAAPEMLEALKGILANAPKPKRIKDDFSYILYLEAARTAIAKAESK